MDGIGVLYAWGDNSNGQLGNGGTTDNSTPRRMSMGQYDGTIYFGDVPTNPIMQAAAGGDHVLAVDIFGTMYSVGDNQVGQLGIASTSDQSTIRKVLKGAYPGTTYMGDDTNNKVVSISGGQQSSYAVTSDGQVYAWGTNVDNQIGDGGSSGGGASGRRESAVHVVKGQNAGTAYLGVVSTN
jgi:alpha-tubulin suppressor-like RCC1 family protein